MPNKLYWLEESWPGRVALAARPRGGDWLEDDIADWKRSGITSVVSLLESEEERDLGLQGEAAEAQKQGMEFTSFPIPDLKVPGSDAKAARLLEKLDRSLASGKNVLVHCRQGIGRTGLVAACLLIRKGLSPGAAVERVSAARGLPTPETEEQREWIDHFATAAK